MKTKIILCLAAMSLSIAAMGQTLKPAKDKQTKKYGYQDKQKNWVIPPTFDDANKFDDGGLAEVKLDGHYGLIDTEGNWVLEPLYDDIGKFDKYGFSELKIKEGKVKLYGLADRSGNLIMPVEYRSISIHGKTGCIMASQELFGTPGLEGATLWGVFSMQGDTLFVPQFLSEPSISDGLLIAKDTNGLLGVVDLEGETCLPFDFLAISRYRDGFRTLDKSFTQATYTSSFNKAESFPQPGAVIPYDPMDDKVRAAAWRSGCIGERLYPNQVRAVTIQPGHSMRRALCMDAPVEWGLGRFLRLEPFKAEEGDPDAMLYADEGKYYTLKAMLYEADGSLVGEVTDKGYLAAECAEGVIYSAGGLETWLILKDPNTLAIPSFSINLTGYRELTHETVFDGLGIRAYDLESLRDVRNYANHLIEIIEGENVGITSYLPPVVDLQEARRMRDVMRPAIFKHAFQMGDVVNCKVREKGEEMEIELSDQLVLRFDDRFQDPYYSFYGDEIIYWGPHNARTVHLGLEPSSSRDAMSSDYDDKGRNWTLVLSLYEEDGTWLRTLARAPFADFIQDGILVFKGLGIALLSPSAARKTGPDGIRLVKMPRPEPLPHVISALESFSVRPGRPR